MKQLTTVLTVCVLLVFLAGCKGAQDNQIEYEKGILSSTGFESEYLNLRFEVPDGFIMATEEEIFGMMSFGADAVGVDRKSIDYARITTVYEMMVSAPEGTPNIIVMVEKLPQDNITLEQYFDAVLTQLSGLNYQFGEITSIELLGQSYQQLISTHEMNGRALSQKYMLRLIDDRVVGFIATSTPDTEDELDTLIQAFTNY